MTRKLPYLFFLLFYSGWAFGQPDCPHVTTNPTIGCAPLLVDAKNGSTGGTLIQYEFDPGVGFRPDSTHTYVIAGNYAVIQKGNFTCGGVQGVLRDTAYVLVKPIPAPLLTTFPCADKKALIVASDPQYDKYNISLNGGPVISILRNQSAPWQLVNMLSATLDVQGLYTVANCGGKGTLAVSSYNNILPPVVTEVNVLNRSQANLKFNAVSGQLYEIRKRVGFTGNFIAVDTLDNVQGSQTVSFNNLSTDTIPYCFQVRAFDYCRLKDSLSPEYCTIVLSGIAQNQANKLTWQSDGSLAFSDYQLKINNQPSSSFASRPNATSFIDVAIVCGVQYCYQITGNYSSGVQTLSNQKCLTAISTAIPPPISEVLSSVVSNVIQLNWSAQVAKVYSIQYSTNKSAFSPLATTATNSYSDVLNNPSAASYCYQVAYSNDCGNTAASSPETCPVLLTGQLNDSISRQLVWQPYVGWPEGVQEYVVEKLDESGKPYFSQTVGLLIVFQDKSLDTLQQIISYRIKAISKTGRISYSNVWEAQQKGGLYMPNAFTPNSDGLNDTFHAEGLFIKEFKMEIWNRNGEGVYASSSFSQGWDGKMNGQAAIVDTYMYKVEATDKLGVSYKRSGTLQLIK